MASVENHKPVAFRIPTPADAPVVWKMVKTDEKLDTNSLHYYMTWFRDFANSSVLATVDDEIVGFLTGYLRPGQLDTYFVWQQGTKRRNGIRDLELKIFDYAAEQQIQAGAKFIEKTVSVNNKTLVTALMRFANARSATIEHRVMFPSSAFPDDHDDEVLYRIGPL